MGILCPSRNGSFERLVFVHRFYIPPAAWNPDALRLDEAESHHALNVLRLQPGEKIVVFNGQGTEATAQLLPESTKRGVLLQTLHRAKTPPLPCRLTLAQAIPKGKNMDLIVQKATELGASEVAPLLSERTVTRVESDENASVKQARWQATVIEAAKQCGQNWLPTVALPKLPRNSSPDVLPARSTSCSSPRSRAIRAICVRCWRSTPQNPRVR